MDNLPKDIRFKIATNLSLLDLKNFCIIDKKQYEDIWNSQDFWRKRLKQDYPHEFFKHGIFIGDSKAKYIYNFTIIHDEIEKFISEFIKTYFGDDFLLYLNDLYRKNLHRALYKLQKSDILINFWFYNYDDNIIIDEAIKPFISQTCEIYDENSRDLLQNINQKIGIDYNDIKWN